MQNHRRPGIRLGAVALGTAAVLFAIFPLIRPYFPFDPSLPAETLAGAGAVVVAAPWIAAHYGLMLAFVLLLFGFLTLHAHIATGRTRWGLLASLAGIALVMPMVGVEVHIFPIIGALYLDGHVAVAAAVERIYQGPAMLVFLLGLLLLAAGAVVFAVAIWRNTGLPRWAGTAFAIGLVFWFPPLPRPVRIVDGLLIGIGGVWLAWSLWQQHRGDAEPAPA